MEQFDMAQLQEWNTEQIDAFFDGEENGVEDITLQKATEKENETKKEEKKESDDYSKEEIDNFFDNDDDTDFSKKPTEETTSEKKEKYSSKSSTIHAARLMKDRGLIDYELEEGEELDEDKALELLEEGHNNSVKAKIKELFDDLPEDLKNLTKFVMNGGDMNAYLYNMLSNNRGLSDIDISKEENQELVLRKAWEQEDMDEDFISAQLETLKGSGKLKMFAEKKLEGFKKEEIKRNAEIQRQQELKAEEQRQQEKEYFKTLKTTISSNEIGIPLSKKDIQEIPDYMTNRKIKLEGGGSVTQFNQDLLSVLQNKNASIQLAKLMKNRNEDGTFNFTDIEQKAKTSLTKEVKDDLRRTKTTKSASTATKGLSLADLL